MPDTKQKPKRRRRWLRYSLRTLLVVITISCIALGYWAHRAGRQKAVVKWVKKNGGYVTYDFEFDGINIKPEPDPGLLQGILGEDYFYTVISVNLDNSEIKDVSRLTQLTRLFYVSLLNTQASQEQVNKLQRALPLCKIDWFPAEIEPKTSAAMFNLNTLRAQIQLYRAQHNSLMPSATLVELTNSTNQAGMVGTGASYPLGPYLIAIPENPFSSSNTVTAITSSPAVTSDVTGDGWLYNAKTGEVWINDATLYTK